MVGMIILMMGMIMLMMGMVILIMTMVSPDPGQFIFRLKFAQLTDYFAQITSKRILSLFFHVNLNITNKYF